MRRKKKKEKEVKKVLAFAKPQTAFAEVLGKDYVMLNAHCSRGGRVFGAVLSLVLRQTTTVNRILVCPPRAVQESTTRRCGYLGNVPLSARN